MKKIIVILITIIFIVGCTNTKDDVNHFEVGQNYLDNFEYDEALTEFQSGIVENPTDEKNYLATAEIYSKKGDIDKAIEILNQGFNANASNTISNSLGQIYLTRGDFEESMKWFESSILKNPTDIEAVKGKIKLLSLNNDTEGLKNYIDTINPEIIDSELLIMKGILNIDDTKEASRLIVQSNTVDDVNQDMSIELRMALTAYENAKTVHNLSEIIYILLNYGWYEVAQIPVSKVLSENPFYETAYVYQGLIYLHTSQYDKSIENFTKVQELNPENVDSFIFHGQVLALKGDVANLFTLIDGLLAKDNLEFSPSQYSTIQQIYYDFGKFQQIESLYTNFSNKTEINANAKLIYIDALIRLEKFNQADLILKEITNMESLTLSEKAKFKSFEAITSYKLDRKQEGLDAIDEAEKIDNSVAIVHYIKGLILEDMGKTVEAEVAFERAVELDLQGNITKLINEN